MYITKISLKIKIHGLFSIQFNIYVETLLIYNLFYTIQQFILQIYFVILSELKVFIVEKFPAYRKLIALLSLF